MILGSNARRSTRSTRSANRLAANRAPGALEIDRRLGFELQAAPRSRVIERQPNGVQRLASHPVQLTSTVKDVARQGVPEPRHVHADLVRPPGVQAATQGRAMGIR